MVNIYETEGGKLNALQDFEEGCWVKVTAATMWEMEPVAKKYNIDIEDMRAALDEEEKSRIVLEDDYTLVLVDIPASEIQHEKKVYTTIPLGLILADGAIITICSEDTPILNTFIKSHVRYFSTKKRTRFVYQILLNSMTTYQNVLRSVDNRRLAIEARIGEEKEDEADLVELHDLESTLVYFETSLRAAGMVIDRLRRYKHIPQFPEDEDLLEDVQVENRQAIEMATIYREIIDGTSELMSNVINNRLNNTMKYGCADDYIRFVRNECRYDWYAFWFYENGIWHYMRSDISAVSVYFMDPLEKTHAVVFYSVLIFCLQKSSVKPDDNDRGGVKAWH